MKIRLFESKYFPWIVIGLAFALRVGYVLELDENPTFLHPVVDAETYAYHATQLAAGNWLWRGQDPFWQPPLYPYFLALVKVVFPQSFLYAARFIQALLGGLLCALVYWLGRRMFQPVVGGIAALMAAFYGPLIFFDGEILPATLAAVLDAAGLLILLQGLERPTNGKFIAAGVLLGLGGLAVATVLGFVAVGAGWMGWYFWSRATPMGQVAQWVGLFLLGTVLVIAPVTLRNYVVGKDLVLISYNAGINFYIGNNEDYDGLVNIRPGWEWDDLVGRPKKEGIEWASEKSAYFFGQAAQYMGAQPFDYLRLLAKKVFLFWHGDEIGRNQDVYFWRNYSNILALTLWKWGIAFPFGLVGPLALVGLLFCVRSRGLTLPIVFVAVYALGVIVFFVTGRYRVPVLPLLILFAAYGGYEIYGYLSRRDWARGGLVLACFGIFALLANWQLAPMNMAGGAAVHYNLGNGYARQGKLDWARREVSEAVRLDSTYWQAWNNLGALYGMQRNMPEARRIFEKVATANPQRPEVWVNLAHAHRALRNNRAAQKVYERALQAQPENGMIYIEYMGLLMEMGEFDKAEKVLKQTLKIFPRDVGRIRGAYNSLKAKILGGRP